LKVSANVKIAVQYFENFGGGANAPNATPPPVARLTPGDWSQSSAAPQNGGGRDVVNAGAVCRGTVRCGQGYEWGWLIFNCAWSASLKVECSLRRWAGGIPVSTGKSSLRVGFRHPEMMRIVSFNAASSFLVWVLRQQVGAAYSAAL